jgi:hypothetical protein
MALSVEQDKALDPVGVGVFGPDGIVFETDGVAHVVKEFPSKDADDIVMSDGEIATLASLLIR